MVMKLVLNLSANRTEYAVKDNDYPGTVVGFSREGYLVVDGCLTERIVYWGFTAGDPPRHTVAFGVDTHKVLYFEEVKPGVYLLHCE
jgi:hypothetical protein